MNAELTRLRIILGPQDDLDHALLTVIAKRLGAGVTFGTSELIAHAEYDDVLGAALAASGVSNARSIGWLLRRCESAVIEGGLKLGRDGQDKHGILWVSEFLERNPHGRIVRHGTTSCGHS